MSEFQVTKELRRTLTRLCGKGFVDSLERAVGGRADGDCRYVVVRVDADDHAFLEARSHGLAHQMKFSDGQSVEPGVEHLLHLLVKAYHDECRGS